MKHFEHNGKEVEFSAVTGEVSGTHKHAETHVKCTVQGEWRIKYIDPLIPRRGSSGS